jgi:hypothetical protein
MMEREEHTETPGDESTATADEERAATDDENRTTTADIASSGGEDPRTEEAMPVQDGDEGSRDRIESDDREPLIGEGETKDVQVRWEQIQVSFVDEPRRAVEDADTLVAELMRRLADSFSQERERLEGQWDRGDEVSTEELRVALQRYRSFFARLLSA